MQKLLAVFYTFFIVFPALAQLGGQNSFEFMNVPHSPRLTALGGVNVSLPDEDLNLAYSNPALTSDTLTGTVAFNYLSYFADINMISFIYQHNFNKWGSWFVGANHMDYGEIQSYDDSGNLIGTFDASDNVVFIGRSHTLRNITFGANLKLISSSLAGFNATALAFDIGGVFKHPNTNLAAGLVFKNMGFMLSDYTESSNSKLPFDVQVGATFKPEHMPFRFSLTAYNFTKGDIGYFDPITDEETGSGDKILRHLTVGAELILSKNVNFRVGYNHLIRQELKLEDRGGGAGFSYGLMFKIKVFEFSYSRGGYHVAGGSHNFAVTINTSMLLKKRKLI